MIGVHPEDHSLIRGTVDVVPATAYVNPHQLGRRDEEEEIDLSGALAGESDVHWDGQRSRREDGERLFISEKGNRCKESEVILVPDAYDVRVERNGWPVARQHVPSIDEGSPLDPEAALRWALQEEDWEQPETNGQSTDLPDEWEGLTFKVFERDEAGDELALETSGRDLEGR